jgi:hypothetical protein
MASNFYYSISDEDLASIIAYLKTLPAVDNELPPTRLGPMGRLLILQDPTILPARVIDHEKPHPPAPEPGATVEYGEYLSISCSFCHGPDFAGGLEPGEGLNITPGGNLGGWSYEEFIQSIRTGVTPEGNELDPLLMPWKKISQLSDTELRAIYMFLQSLPAVETPPLTTPASSSQ